jgi:hypothetical protein
LKALSQSRRTWKQILKTRWILKNIAKFLLSVSVAIRILVFRFQTQMISWNIKMLLSFWLKSWMISRTNNLRNLSFSSFLTALRSKTHF